MQYYKWQKCSKHMWPTIQCHGDSKSCNWKKNHWSFFYFFLVVLINNSYLTNLWLSLLELKSMTFLFELILILLFMIDEETLYALMKAMLFYCYIVLSWVLCNLWVSDWLLFNSRWAMLRLCHANLRVDEMTRIYVWPRNTRLVEFIYYYMTIIKFTCRFTRSPGLFSSQPVITFTA